MTDESVTVLLCYDGSAQAEHAVETAGKLFGGARAHILYVWEPVERIVARYSVLAPYMGEEVGTADASIEAEAGKTLDAGVALASSAGLDAVAHSARLESTVWEAVLAAAQSLGADVIVTGTRSLHGLREVFSDTLSHHLIQHSPIAVLAIPKPAEEAAG